MEKPPAINSSPWLAMGRVFRLGDEQLLDVVNLAALPNVIGRILRLCWQYRFRLGLGAVAILGATIFTLAIPRLLGVAVDRVHLFSQGGNTSGLLSLALILLAVSALRGITTMIGGYQCEVVAQRVACDLRLAFFEKMQRLGFDFHDHVHSGDLITRGMLDLEGVRAFVEIGIQRLVSLSLLLVLGATFMIRTDPLLAALSLSFVPFVAWRAGRTGLFLRLTWTRLQQKMSILTRIIEENLQGVRVVKAFAALDHEIDKFDGAADVALKLSNDRILIRTASISTLTFAFYSAMALVLWIGGHEVMRGTITIGRLTEFLAFMTVLQTPVRQITIMVNTFARAISSGSRLFEILDLTPSVQDRPGAVTLEKSRGHLRFQDVEFSYGLDLPNALSGVSFDMLPGQTLGILGAPGSGKSTIVHLLARFYDVTKGYIAIDGHDVRDIALPSLRRLVGAVQQDVFLFDSSVADNVAYAEPDANEDRIVEAATTAHIHEYVESLPDGYRTSVGERGVSLSGGQRQRVSIARGVLPGPAILVFDDATSAIDAGTEHRLRQALQRAASGRTSIVIAHRLASVMHADKIIVLDRGRIIERGTHASLLAADGFYAELYRLQSEGSGAAVANEEFHLERTAT